MAAPKFKLDNLIAIVDHNNGQIDGPVKEVMDIEPLAGKFFRERQQARFSGVRVRAMIREKYDHQHRRLARRKISERIHFPVDAFEAEVGRGVAERELARVGRHLAFEIHGAVSVALDLGLGVERATHERGGESEAEKRFHGAEVSGERGD